MQLQRLRALEPLHSPSLFFAESQAAAATFVRRPVCPDTCVALIERCGSSTSLKAVHAAMLRASLHLHLHFLTHLVARYASLGSLPLARALFSRSESSSDVFLWNVVIRGCVNGLRHRPSLGLYARMRGLGIGPDNFTFPFVLKACGCLGDLKSGALAHHDALRSGYDSDVFVGNSLVAMYGKCGRVDVARRVFDRMSDRNVVSWSSMIGACARNGCYEDGLRLFWEMLDGGVWPNKGAAVDAMACVRREAEADAVCRVAMDNGLDSDLSVLHAAMIMYARCGRVDVARALFDGIHDKDLVCWSSMIEAYAKADMPLKALDLFRELLCLCIDPDAITLLSVLRACLELGSFLRACTVHAIIIRRILEDCVALNTCMVDLYAKCGNLEYARKLFDLMPEKNLISWSAMISGYAMHGHGREALYLFDRMKFSVKPDHIVFVSVLSACSHSGLLNEGWECFESMSRDFGVTPIHEHYACMVDLLGRAGRLDEAVDFIERMPIEPNAGVWGALLGASRIHRDVERAEKAAKFLFELDPENPGRYAVLSNIYASLGNKEEANQIRDLMKRREVRKLSGHAIIEIGNRIYTFVAGDRSHRQTDVIYSELDKLMAKTRLEGYKPNIHEAEEEIKEKM
ncbi:pentatricopeptide repeat-containing protein At1g11290, chloroplastic-like [Syzygium oleosum]|uniref:pentatricopeptide repeat-containing protein At1g11290, chloroplastic-like n=1 Tax=Syzygium oleosum TaxID=219896 RepID=UPI0011D18839|nr:pentatricopeptide repeat-containing protein At1g11290, chloroplastic-like [Syzygium oleosum]